MRTAGALACCALLLPLIGTVRNEVPSNRAMPLKARQTQSPVRVELRAQLTRGNQLFHQSQFNQANQVFNSVFWSARAAMIQDLQARAAGNIGSCQFARHEYQNALRSFFEARRLALRVNDRNETAALDTNIASLYSEIGDLETAASWMQGAADQMTGTDRTEHLPEIQIQLATLRARQDRMPEALELFRQGIDGADRLGNLNLYTIGWNRLGEEFLKRGDLPDAERAFLEAFRVRKLNHLPMEILYRNLGRLRLMQGDIISASRLLDRYVESAERPNGPLPVWDVYYSRGRVRLTQGHLADALADLRVAVRLARAWRWSAVSNDAGRKGVESMLDQVYAALIETGNRLYAGNHDPAIVRETFEAAEENRASSLRALLTRPKVEDLSPEYWDAVMRLQRAEVAALRSSTVSARQAAAEARAEVARLDSEHWTAANPGHPERLTSRLLRMLDSDSALISFYLGDSESWVWAVDRAGVELYALPPRQQIEDRIDAATHAMRNGTNGDPAADEALYRTMFDGLAPRFLQKKRWLVAVDQGEHTVLVHSTPRPTLFDIPFAALRIPGGRRKRFLVEDHSTTLIPGAAYWADSVESSPQIQPSGFFLGVGDPIYNTADPRRGGTPAASAPSHALTAWAAPGAQRFALPRLVGSSAELDACVLAWNGTRVLLKGPSASRAELQAQLKRNPAIIHFATHVMPASTGPTTGLIALSLDWNGESELLSPEEIAHWKVNAGLVVLSGCASVQGSVAPGTGLMGLTRAWLAAGARNVIASRWSMPDDSGPLFSALYRNLRGPAHPDAADALRLAQIEMIRSGGWRAAPRYWGAYVAVGSRWRVEE